VALVNGREATIREQVVEHPELGERLVGRVGNDLHDPLKPGRDHVLPDRVEVPGEMDVVIGPIAGRRDDPLFFFLQGIDVHAPGAPFAESIQ
jgi:hypothetical protein